MGKQKKFTENLIKTVTAKAPEYQKRSNTTSQTTANSTKKSSVKQK